MKEKEQKFIEGCNHYGNSWISSKGETKIIKNDLKSEKNTLSGFPDGVNYSGFQSMEAANDFP